MRYTDRHEHFPGKVIISYPLHWGGMVADAGMWMAELDGEVLDYNPKAALIADAVANNRAYVVLRLHSDGTASVVEQ